MTATFTSLIPELTYPSGRDGIVWEITGIAQYHDALAAITRDARFGALAAHALGASRVQLLQDSLRYKPAHDGGSPRARRTIILRMFDGDCRLDPAALPPEAAQFFPTDADGHLSADRFPVVFP